MGLTRAPRGTAAAVPELVRDPAVGVWQPLAASQPAVVRAEVERFGLCWETPRVPFLFGKQT